MKRFVTWYSTAFSVITAAVYFLAGAGILSAGLSVEPDEAPPFIFFVAGAYYLIIGYLVRIERKWLRLTLAVLNTFVILIFFQMWSGNPEVLTSPAGLGTKIPQFFLEAGLIYLTVQAWKKRTGEGKN